MYVKELNAEAASSTVPLSQIVATDLAHAFISQLATSINLRVLSIKGPVADRYLLRDARVSADADVWVEPAGFDRLCVALESRGWHKRVGRAMPSLLPPHASTYIHDDWPCDLDVHRTFSGFFADPDEAFEAVWTTRATMIIAGHPVVVPSRAAAALIGALHSLRNSGTRRAEEEGRRVREVIADEFSNAQRDEFYRVAREGGAVWVLRELISDTGLGEVFLDLSPEQERAWMLHVAYAADGSSVGWWEQLRGARWLSKPGLLVRALWVPRAEIPRNSYSAMPSRRDARRYQVRRWRRGLIAMWRFAAKRTPS